jgi:outer membrane protein OmpA-like peptidoglycan-associated protein
LLAYITNPANGGFSGILDRFRNAGLGDVVNSWIHTGDNTPVTEAQVENALGSDAIGTIASQAGVERGTATAAIAGMLPQVVDTLTPNGEVPDNSSLLSRVGGFLSDWGGAIGGAVAGGMGAAAGAASGAAHKAGDAAGATYDKGKEVLGSGVGAVRNMGSSLDNSGGSGSILKWLIPLLLLGLLVVIGYMFCGRSSTPTGPANANLNTNVNRSNANLYTNANRANAANTNVDNSNAAGVANRSLSEVTLPNGTKLQAYPGGIEDQLVKYISSDEYKNATADQLKDKWFSFDDLNFKFGTTELAPESKRQMDNIAAILKAYPNVKIKIGGYTDKKGDDAANLKLSDGRAKAVQAALKAAGVGGQVPEAEGYGEQFATVDENASDDARKVDRKTAIRLIK